MPKTPSGERKNIPSDIADSEVVTGDKITVGNEVRIHFSRNRLGPFTGSNLSWRRSDVMMKNLDSITGTVAQVLKTREGEGKAWLVQTEYGSIPIWESELTVI